MAHTIPSDIANNPIVIGWTFGLHKRCLRRVLEDGGIVRLWYYNDADPAARWRLEYSDVNVAYLYSSLDDAIEWADQIAADHGGWASPPIGFAQCLPTSSNYYWCRTGFPTHGKPVLLCWQYNQQSPIEFAIVDFYQSESGWLPRLHCCGEELYFDESTLYAWAELMPQPALGDWLSNLG